MNKGCCKERGFTPLDRFNNALNKVTTSHYLTGFTMIEVMVALAIVSISLGVFISILGNSMKMRWKMEDHAKNVVTARVTAEKFSLGLLEDDMEGETEDGTHWEIIPIEIKGRRSDENEILFEDEDDVSIKKIDFYNVVVGGVEVCSSAKGTKR